MNRQTPLDILSVELYIKRETENRESLERSINSKIQQQQQLLLEIERLRGALDYNGFVMEGLKKDLTILKAAAAAAEAVAKNNSDTVSADGPPAAPGGS